MNPPPILSLVSSQGIRTHETTNAPKKRVKRLFSKEEDEIIRILVMKCGLGHWRYIASQLENRTARQVRERWKNYLCPGVENPAWNEADDAKLIALVKEHGQHWSKIALEFGTRTDVHIKNRWALLQRKESREEKKEPDSTAGNGLIEFWDEKWDSDSN